MNDRYLKSLHDDFTYLIQKYKLNDTIIVSNKVIIKPNGYNDDQALSCLCAGMENILVDMITKLALSDYYMDFDMAYNRTIKDMNIVLSILKKRVKQRIKEVKDKHIKYKYN